MSVEKRSGKTVLIFDCFSGLAGDMFLGALADLGVSMDKVSNLMQESGLDFVKFEVKQIESNGIQAKQVKVVPSTDRHIHDYKEMKGLIEDSRLQERVKARALAVLKRLAEAEAKVHGMPVEQVHFHEVGNWDTIGDVVGVSIALEIIEPKPCEVWFTEIPVGRGFVKAAHGMLPVPAPATLELLRETPIRFEQVKTELTTPTGAAIATAIGSRFGNLPLFTPIRIGYGAGTKRIEDRPNLLRAVLAKVQREEKKELVVKAVVDDQPGTEVSYTMRQLFENGAIDVWTTPVLMKKGRPGYELSFICDEAGLEKLISVLFTTSRTIGCRVYEVRRVKLERQIESVETKFGTVRVKFAWYNGKVVNAQPESEDVERLASSHEVPVKAIWAEAANKAYLLAFKRQND